MFSNPIKIKLVWSPDSSLMSQSMKCHQTVIIENGQTAWPEGDRKVYKGLYTGAYYLG